MFVFVCFLLTRDRSRTLGNIPVPPVLRGDEYILQNTGEDIHREERKLTFKVKQES